jgi:hypothetical protein
MENLTWCVGKVCVPQDDVVALLVVSGGKIKGAGQTLEGGKDILRSTSVLRSNRHPY